MADKGRAQGSLARGKGYGGEGRHGNGSHVQLLVDTEAKMTEIFYSHAIRQALEEEMARDERVILIGEDIAEYGGAFKITAEMAERFGKERVRNTPISENGFVGVAVAESTAIYSLVVAILLMFVAK